MPLLGCVDCNKALSPTTQVCSGCQSQDPFGSKRREKRMKICLLVIVMMGVITAGVSHTWGLWQVGTVLSLTQGWQA